MNKKGKKKWITTTIKDCTVTPFTASGPGGQHRNRNKTAIRIVHKASGAVGEGKEYKSQHQNKKAAFTRMGESKTYQIWARIEVARRQGRATPEEIVKATMIPENLKIEVRNNGPWEEEK